MRCPGRVPWEVEQLDFAVSDRGSAWMPGRSGTDVARHPLLATVRLAVVIPADLARDRCGVALDDRFRPDRMARAWPGQVGHCMISVGSTGRVAPS